MNSSSHRKPSPESEFSRFIKSLDLETVTEVVRRLTIAFNASGYPELGSRVEPLKQAFLNLATEPDRLLNFNPIYREVIVDLVKMIRSEKTIPAGSHKFVRDMLRHRFTTFPIRALPSTDPPISADEMARQLSQSPAVASVAIVVEAGGYSNIKVTYHE